MDSLERRIDGLDTRMEALDARMDGLNNRMHVKFDLLSSRIDGLVAEVGHVNLILGELVDKVHAHDRVA